MHFIFLHVNFYFRKHFLYKSSDITRNSFISHTHTHTHTHTHVNEIDYFNTCFPCRRKYLFLIFSTFLGN